MRLVTSEWQLTAAGELLVETLATEGIPINTEGIAYQQAISGGGAFQEPSASPGTFFGRNPGYAALLWEFAQPAIAALEVANDLSADAQQAIYTARLAPMLERLESAINEAQR